MHFLMCKTNTSLARVEKYSAVDEALNLIYLYIQEVYSPKEVELICGELKSIARRDDFQCVEVASSKRTYTQVQDALSKINEKQSIRKSKGVYYTPNDVVRFILTNSIKASFGKLTASNVSDLNMDNIPYRSFCCRKTVFDPTCGAGEYLLAALEIKIDLLKKNAKITNRLIQEVVSTIYGNDVNVESIIIAELRLLLFIIESCGVDYCIGLGNVMNRRFTSFDFIADEVSFEDKYHIVIGNPPYVEDFKSGLELSDKYGNIYANILLNAARKLEKNGSIGFIIPLSYVSTPRMKKLREELGDLVPEQYILSYFDDLDLSPLLDYSWNNTKNIRKIDIDLTCEEYGFKGRGCIGLLIKNDMPVEEIEILSKDVEIDGEIYTLSSSVKYKNNCITETSTSISVDEDGEIDTNTSWSERFKSKSSLSIHGIEVPYNLFPNYSNKMSKAVLNIPFPFSFRLDIGVNSDLNLNSARDQIIYDEKWLTFEENLYQVICKRLKEQLSLSDWERLNEIIQKNGKNIFSRVANNIE